MASICFFYRVWENAFANEPLEERAYNKQSLENVQSCNETILFF